MMSQCENREITIAQVLCNAKSCMQKLCFCKQTRVKLVSTTKSSDKFVTAQNFVINKISFDLGSIKHRHTRVKKCL